jgi:hypothetical protein
MRRRVMLHRKGPDDPGCIGTIQICQSFQEAFPGIWMPYKGYRLDYGSSDEAASVRGKVVRINTTTARNVSVNDVDDSLFDFEFPPGTEVVDLVNQRSYYIPNAASLRSAATKMGLFCGNGGDGLV